MNACPPALPEIAPREEILPRNHAGAQHGPAALNRAEKAAIILGVLGSEAAASLLEQLDEACHRNFASAMARLERVDAETATAVIREFLAELEASEMKISGGLERAREMLQDFMNEATLDRILDDAEQPSIHNVWQKLVKVDDGALADFLDREHPQTAAVVVNRLAPDHAARVLGRLPQDKACEIVMGLTRASGLAPTVVEAIGASVSRDFLANQRQDGRKYTPADRIGAIMNYAAGDVRQTVLAFLGRADATLLTQVRSRMFTFQDIPERIEKRDVTAIVRAVPNDVLLQALAGAADNAPETRDFLLANISSRVSEQLREDLSEMGPVKVRVAEEAQTGIIKAIRDLETVGTLKLIELED